MIEKKRDQRAVTEIVNIDELVPQDHLLRKIEEAVEFTHIYSIVEKLYCEDNGRPGVDPVVLFKIVLLQHIYGLPSLRQTVRDVQMNLAYRWFLGYSLNEEVPHFATVSYAFCQRFSMEVVREVFEWILGEASKAGFLSPEVVFVDATHIKASANVHKRCKREIPKTARSYEEQLRAEVNAEREERGKKPFDGGDGNSGTRVVTESTTDPDSGLFHKGEHKVCFAYGAHTVCDANNFILEAEITAGNIHDSIVFDTVYERVTDKFPEVESVVADAGYKTPWICKSVIDDGRVPSLPYKRPMTKKGNHPQWEYAYDEYYDVIICPEYKLLSYSTTNRDGYREYKSNPNDCKNCATREQCTLSKNSQKMVQRHIWQDYMEQAEDIRHSPLGRESYRMRSQTIERVFADAKEKHAMRYTHHRGLEQVSKWVLLKYTAMNLKKLATWKAGTLLRFALYLLSNISLCKEPYFAVA